MIRKDCLISKESIHRNLSHSRGFTSATTTTSTTLVVSLVVFVLFFYFLNNNNNNKFFFFFFSSPAVSHRVEDTISKQSMRCGMTFRG